MLIDDNRSTYGYPEPLRPPVARSQAAAQWFRVDRQTAAYLGKEHTRTAELKQGDKMNAKTDMSAEVVIFIDQQQFKLEDREYTPRDLLKLAGDDPAETTLVLKHGNDLEKLTDLDKAFQPKSGEHFVVFHNSPTPVS